MLSPPTSDEANIWRFINALPDVLLWQTTPDGNLSFVSDGLAALLGKAREELLADPALWRDRIYAGHRRRYDRAVKTARDNQTYTDVEYRGRLPATGLTRLRDHIMVDPETGDIFGITTQIGEQHDTTERLGFLNKAAKLFASSLDTTKLLEELGDLITGSLANICIIELIQDDGPVVIVRSDSNRRLQTSLEGAGALVLDGRAIPARLKQGRAILHDGMSPRGRRSLLGPARDRVFGRRPPHSVIISPLSVRRQLLGTVTMLCTDKNREYTGKDVDLARDVCNHAAIALDHARLFEETANEQVKLSTENEMKDEFLALMSHELRSPLTVIYGVSRILPRILPPLDETARQFVDDLNTASERTVRLVDDLMLLARLNLGESPELEPVEVSMLLGDVAGDFRNQYPDRALKLPAELDSVAVIGSPPYMRQVLFNLLSNAHKYSPTDGELEIGVTSGGEDVTITVTDSGPGVPENEIDHLFERFYRASTSDGISGSGMGLAICKRLIEALGGRIWAENTKRRGLAVSFSLRASPDR